MEFGPGMSPKICVFKGGPHRGAIGGCGAFRSRGFVGGLGPSVPSKDPVGPSPFLFLSSLPLSGQVVHILLQHVHPPYCVTSHRPKSSVSTSRVVDPLKQ